MSHISFVLTILLFAWLLELCVLLVVLDLSLSGFVFVFCISCKNYTITLLGKPTFHVLYNYNYA